MARTKKEIKIKEPVTIRFKEAKGKQSIYLDCYVNGKRSYEFLSKDIGYIYPNTDYATRAANAAVMQKANAIKMQRIAEIYNGKNNIQKISKNGKMLLLDWMREYMQRQIDNGKKGTRQIEYTIKILETYAGANTKMQDIDKNFCLGYLHFIKHLQPNRAHAQITSSHSKSKTYTGTEADFFASSAKMQLKTDAEIKYISAPTANNYYRCFNCALNAAVREEIILSNPFEKIDKIEKIKVPESMREYLTIDELKRLNETECKRIDIKNAFLFSCFCGLRISDIKNITWGQVTNDNGQLRLQLEMKKTKDPIYLPLSEKAVQYMPQNNDAKAEDKIFNIPDGQICNKIIAQLAKDAGITKKVTFHVARHTFATMMLTLGADLFTVSKLLGHADIETTQIYAKIVNSKKDDAVNLANNIF